MSNPITRAHATLVTHFSNELMGEVFHAIMGARLRSHAGDPMTLTIESFRTIQRPDRPMSREFKLTLNLQPITREWNSENEQKAELNNVVYGIGTAMGLSEEATGYEGKSSMGPFDAIITLSRDEEVKNGLHFVFTFQG